MKEKTYIVLTAIGIVGGIFLASDFGNTAIWAVIMVGGGFFIYLISKNSE